MAAAEETPTAPSLPPAEPAPLDGAGLLALLSAPAASSGPPALEGPGSAPPPALVPALPSAPPAPALLDASGPSLPSSRRKGGRGRVLQGAHHVYDVDERHPGQEQPQLEVAPITVYGSDTVFAPGRQIAVSKRYICYALRNASIRVLNVNTALRALVKGHAARVTDMAFFSPNAHLLASASADGRIMVWRISEELVTDGKMHIREHVLCSLQLHGPWGNTPICPQVCWHPRMQDILVAACGQYVMFVSLSRLSAQSGPGTVEAPLTCSVEQPLPGVHLLAGHRAPVTFLGSPPFATTLLATPSQDGTVRIWGEATPPCVSILEPHEGQPVFSAAFLLPPGAAPHHALLLTGGPENHELKLWAAASAQSMPPPPGGWQCVQSLRLCASRSSTDDSATPFFNHIHVVPSASLVLLGNARRPAIYAVHVHWGACPQEARFDYIAEFALTMPVLSFTASADNEAAASGQVHLFCVQPQAIQQYTLDVADCLPPHEDPLPSQESQPIEPAELQSLNNHRGPVTTPAVAFLAQTPSVSGAFGSPVDRPVPTDVPAVGSVNQAEASARLDMEHKQVVENLPIASISSQQVAPNQEDDTRQPEEPHEATSRFVSEPGAGPEVDLLGLAPQLATPPITDAGSGPGMAATHLLTPSEMLTRMGVSQASTAQPTIALDNSSKPASGNKADKSVDDVAVLQSGVMAAPPSEQLPADDHLPSDPSSVVPQAAAEKHPLEGPPSADYRQNDSDVEPRIISVEQNEGHATAGGLVGKTQMPEVKVKDPSPAESDRLGAASTVGGPLPGTSNKLGVAQASALPAAELVPMDRSLIPLLEDVMERELVGRLPAMVAGPVVKEGRRIEAALATRLERIVKAQAEAQWARLQEDMAKRERLERERSQQICEQVAAAVTREVQPAVEALLRSEIGSLAPALAISIGPSMEASLDRSADAALQKLSPQVVTQIDAAVSRHIATQFQSVVPGLIQDGLQACFQNSLIPAVEAACRNMLLQVDDAIKNGLEEHAVAAQRQPSALADSLKAALATVASIAATLREHGQSQQMHETSTEPLGQQLAASKEEIGSLQNGATQVLSLQHVEEALDPTRELLRLVKEEQYEAAFMKALSLADVATVSWLCAQVDPDICFSTTPGFSQGVLLSLMQQLGCDLARDLPLKIQWLRYAALALNPTDARLAPHLQPILEPLYQNLHHVAHTAGEAAPALRLLMHVINSLLSSYR